MRGVILLFTASGFVLGTLFGYAGHFLLNRGETHSAQAMPAQAMPARAMAGPVLHYVGVDGAAPVVARTIDSAVRAHLSARGLRLTGQPDGCAVRLGASFDHRLAGEEARVTLIWMLHAPDGREIARVRMENAVPRAMLAGDWSDDAPDIARSVGDSVQRIFAEVPPVC